MARLAQAPTATVADCFTAPVCTVEHTWRTCCARVTDSSRKNTILRKLNEFLDDAREMARSGRQPTNKQGLTAPSHYKVNGGRNNVLSVLGRPILRRAIAKPAAVLSREAYGGGSAGPARLRDTRRFLPPKHAVSGRRAKEPRGDARDGSGGPQVSVRSGESAYP